MSGTASSRAEARALGLKTYFTGKACKAGHVAERLTSTGACMECKKATTAAWEAANADRRKAQAATWRATNRDHKKALDAAWKAAHPDKVKAHRAAWKAANPDKAKAQAAAWRAAHPDKVKARNDRHRAEGLAGEHEARRKAGPRCPAWTREDPSAIRQMREIYRMARLLGWHVDHVVPLRGADVTGLHVPGNLCIRPSFANEAKGTTHADSHPEADALTAAALLHLTFRAIPATAGAAAALRLV